MDSYFFLLLHGFFFQKYETDHKQEIQIEIMRNIFRNMCVNSITLYHERTLNIRVYCFKKLALLILSAILKVIIK